MTKNLLVTHENYDAVLETALIGSIKFQNYNSDCVGSRDVQLARIGNILLDELMMVVINSGNSPFTMVDPAYEWADYALSERYKKEDYAHITEIQPFSVEIEGCADFFQMCKNVQDTVTDRAQFLADMKYR